MTPLELEILTESTIVILVSLGISIAALPPLIKRLEKSGTVTIDRYKRDNRLVPTRGGLVILGVAFIIAGIATLCEHLSLPIHVTGTDWAILIVSGLFGAFGLVDDFVDVGRPVKVFMLFFFSYRLIFEINSTAVVFPLIGAMDMGAIYLFLIVPLYVLVTANLVNMHSGFNGLASGLSTIIMGFLLLKLLLSGYHGGIFILSSVFGATLGFLWYNRYPARIFLGNTGSLAIGAVIGAIIVVSGFIISGFVMLIPHTVNFLMYVYWRVMHRLHPADRRWRLEKFGRVRADGTLEVPNPLTLKWVLPYYFRMTESQAVMCMYALSIPFCIAALFIHG